MPITVKDTDCKEAPIKTDPKLLKRALDNLLRNAMRYADSQIMLEVTEDEEHCMISIHDDGNGIDEKTGLTCLRHFTAPTNLVIKAPAALV